MKLNRFACLLLVTVSLLFTHSLNAQTNDVITVSNTPVIPDVVIPTPDTNVQAVLTVTGPTPVALTELTGIKPLDALLTGKLGWLAQLIAILGSIRVALVPFGGKIQRWLADRMNAIASRNSVDDDQYLRELFSAKWYKFLAFILMFASIKLPTLPDLERAIKLQQEAVLDAQNSNPASPGGLGSTNQ